MQQDMEPDNQGEKQVEKLTTTAHSHDGKTLMEIEAKR
jgi:hypothetical protein